VTQTLVSQPSLFNPTDRQDIDRLLLQDPAITSECAQWNGLSMAHFNDYPAGEACEHSLTHHVLNIMDFPGAITAQRRLDDCYGQHHYRRGDTILVPAHTTHWARWHGDGDMTVIILDPEFVDRVAQEATGGDRVCLVPRIAVADPRLHHIALALRSELETGCTMGRLYGESLATALAALLVHEYGVRRPQAIENEGLPPRILRQVRDYIEAHLERSLGLEELAAIAHISPHYFVKCFKQATGLTPHQYVIQARVQQAQRLLSLGDMAIVDVAQAVGFANQSHLNRHCKRLLGVTPRQLKLKN
jgi:AraC family transcriptional regulator